MKLSFNIARHFIASNKSQTVLILLGIAIGLSVQIFIGALIQGLQKDLINITIGTSSHITITDGNGYINNYNEIVKVLNENKQIKYISPIITKNAFIINNSNNAPIVLKGITFNKKSNIYKIEDKLINGKLPLNNGEIIIGVDLSEKLDLKIGDEYLITTPEGINKNYKVVGIVDYKVKGVNDTQIITSLNTMQSYFYDNNRVTAIETQVDKIFEADKIANSLNIDGLTVTNWKDNNSQLLSGLSGQSTSSLMIQVFVMISVLLAIASVLIISVVQKSKQVGILKAMGLNNKSTSLIFLFQGLILGVIGATLGVIFGLGLLYSFTTFAVGPDGLPVVNVYISISFIITSWIIAVIAALVSSILPARRSFKLSPMEVIRNG